jgi:hypothetical protein
MVCTDAAARGIDIPDITRVVQADFPASAVDFLHQVSPPHRDVLMWLAGFIYSWLAHALSPPCPLSPSLLPSPHTPARIHRSPLTLFRLGHLCSKPRPCILLGFP